MKNNNDHQSEIRKARNTVIRRVTTDVLVNPAVVEKNSGKLGPRPVRKRKTNYEKKIQNNPLIFGT